MKQSKVSIVIPCYNKAEYISEMLDSAIRQHWDNIEIILVDDGSTDGTGDIIDEYGNKFNERGYNSIIIHQPNGGVCAATKAGLERVTGNYLCIVDADDILDDMYVKTMADILDESIEYDAVTCAREKFAFHEGKRLVVDTWSPDKTKDKITIQDYITVRAYTAIWVYMVRTSFYMKLGVPQNYANKSKGSHEPGFMIPFTAYQPVVKPVDKYLYYFRVGTGESHSQHNSYDKIQQYRDEYKNLQIAAINALPDIVLDKCQKMALSMLCEYYAVRLVWKQAKAEKNELTEKCFISEMIQLANKWFAGTHKLTYEIIEQKEGYFVSALEERIIHLYNRTRPEKIIKYYPTERTIGYGALGKSAQRFLPILEGTELMPTELWDIAGDGIKVKLPELDTITKEDRVIVFPVSGLHEIFDELPCETVFVEQLAPFRDIMRKKMHQIDLLLNAKFDVIGGE